jgi:hypothetical protein
MESDKFHTKKKSIIKPINKKGQKEKPFNWDEFINSDEAKKQDSIQDDPEWKKSWDKNILEKED